MEQLFESTYNAILDAAGNRRDQVQGQLGDVEVLPDPVVEEEESDAATDTGGPETPASEGAEGEQNAAAEGAPAAEATEPQ